MAELLELLKGLKPLADVGITGSVAVLATWYAIRKDADVRRIEKEKLAIEREKLALVQAAAQEKLQITREAYDRMISAAERQTERLALISAEQSQTISALTEAVQIEEQLDAGPTSDLLALPEPRPSSKPPGKGR